MSVGIGEGGGGGEEYKKFVLVCGVYISRFNNTNLLKDC